MAGKSPIEWTEATWNPIVGCSILSPGCAHCYAMPMAARIDAINEAAAFADKAVPVRHYSGTTKNVNGHPVWTGKVAIAGDDILLVPLKRQKPTIYFVNSMGDPFHESVPDAWIDRVFAVMALSPQHTFQVLTKRAKRMRDYFTKRQFRDVHPLEVRHDAINAAMDEIAPAHWCKRELNDYSAEGLPLPNVWLGVSAERQQEADERIPLLLQTPAAVRFISAEPLLGPIDLNRIHEHGEMQGGGAWDSWESCLNGKRFDMWAGDDEDPMQPGYPKLDWVIAGGESGPDARPMHPEWARSLRDQCADAGVAFFFKQWGRWSPTHPDWPNVISHAVADDGTVYLSIDIAFPDGARHGEAVRAGHDKAHLTSMYPIGKARAGRQLDGKLHNAMPERVR